ncbi:MAG: hypothetical protein AAFQ45_12440 [Pseudomonadota bacterium]
MSALRLMMTGLGLALLASPAAAQQAQLNTTQINNEIVGKVLSGRRGLMSFKMLHRPDGTSQMEAGLRSMDGTWRVTEDQLCMTWPKFRGGKERCSPLTKVGPARYKLRNGMVLTAQ